MAVCLAAICGLLLAGCGGGAKTGSPGDTAVNYTNALAAGDTTKACSYLSRALRQAVESSSSEHGDTRCGDVSSSPTVDLAKVGQVQKSGDSATVELDGAGGKAVVVNEVRERGEWRISGVKTP